MATCAEKCAEKNQFAGLRTRLDEIQQMITDLHTDELNGVIEKNDHPGVRYCLAQLKGREEDLRMKLKEVIYPPDYYYNSGTKSETQHYADENPATYSATSGSRS